jgi:hypothetical protein
VIWAPLVDPPLGSAETAIGEPEPVSAAFGRHPAMSDSRPASEIKNDETMPAVFRAKVHPGARDIETSKGYRIANSERQPYKTKTLRAIPLFGWILRCQSGIPSPPTPIDSLRACGFAKISSQLSCLARLLLFYGFDQKKVLPT